MNTMTHALAQAGLKVSQKERIWRFVKARTGEGGVPSTVISDALAIPNNSVSSILCDMERRGMVVAIATDSGPRGRRKVYVTDMDKYEHLAVPAPVQPNSGNTSPSRIDIDNMTVAECRALYVRLHKMFGG